ncbi:MAG: TetR family transcriptional regulator [Muricauda sp. TMED12]|nr:MAG: TetR family transcriptional regulator [Muricauda sp. TMED12]
MKDAKRELILNAAVECAKLVGYMNIQRADIAQRADVATGTVNKYFGTMNQLKRAVMRHAIEKDIPEIMLQGIANNDNQVMKLTPDRRREICLTATNL